MRMAKRYIEEVELAQYNFTRDKWDWCEGDILNTALSLRWRGKCLARPWNYTTTITIIKTAQWKNQLHKDTMED